MSAHRRTKRSAGCRSSSTPCRGTQAAHRGLGQRLARRVLSREPTQKANATMRIHQRLHQLRKHGGGLSRGERKWHGAPRTLTLNPTQGRPLRAQGTAG